MSWHYLQEQGEGFWAESCLDGAPSALLRLIPTADRCSLPDSATDIFRGSRSGMTCARSTDAHGAEQLTLFPADSHARGFPRRVRAEDLPTSVLDFGAKCSELLERYDLVLSGRKTVRISVPVASTSFCAGLTLWGMVRDGVFWELGTSVRPISAIDSGSLLPTPTASLYGSSNNGNPRDHRTRYRKRGKKSLEAILGGVCHHFREWMMGWPIGWSGLEPLATDKFRQWSQHHGKFFPGARPSKCHF